MRRKLLIVGVVGALAAAGGGAYAASQAGGPTSRQAFLDDVAQRLHVTPQRLVAALKGAYLDRITAVEAAGLITKAQANALSARAKQQKGFAPLGGLIPFAGPLPASVYCPAMAPGFFPKLPKGFALRFQKRFTPKLLKRLGSIPPGASLAPLPLRVMPFLGLHQLLAAASYLGVSPGALAKVLTAGRSLSQIAQGHRKTAGGLIRAMATVMKARLDAAVAAHAITAAQAQKMLKAYRNLITAVVTRKPVTPFALRFPLAMRLAMKFRSIHRLGVPVPAGAVMPRAFSCAVGLAALAPR